MQGTHTNQHVSYENRLPEMIRWIFLALLIFAISVSAIAQDITISTGRSEIKSGAAETRPAVARYKKPHSGGSPGSYPTRSGVYLSTFQNEEKQMTGETRTQHGTAEKADHADPSDFEFTDKNPNETKSGTNFADRFSNIGVTVNTIGKTTVPTISFLTDVFASNNLAATSAVWTSYHTESAHSYTVSAFSLAIGVGASYYLNKLLKLDKKTGSVYAGAMLTSTTATVSAGGESATKTSLGGLARIGGRYHVAKTLGVFSELQIGKGDPAIIVGISLIRIK